MTSALRDAVVSTGGAVAVLTASQLGDLGEVLMSASFSRKQECAADDYGYDFLKSLGKNPWAMAMAFEELQSVFDSKDIDITTLEEDVLDNASYFGRIFARSGGLSCAVEQGLKEQNIEFDLKAVSCDGIEECRMALLKKSKNVLDANFIEGMACVGGCIGGAGCLTHGEKNKAEVDKYGREAYEKTISDAVSFLK